MLTTCHLPVGWVGWAHGGGTLAVQESAAALGPSGQSSDHPDHRQRDAGGASRERGAGVSGAFSLPGAREQAVTHVGARQGCKGRVAGEVVGAVHLHSQSSAVGASHCARRGKGGTREISWPCLFVWTGFGTGKSGGEKKGRRIAAFGSHVQCQWRRSTQGRVSSGTPSMRSSMKESRVFTHVQCLSRRMTPGGSTPAPAARPACAARSPRRVGACSSPCDAPATPPRLARPSAAAGTRRRGDPSYPVQRGAAGQRLTDVGVGGGGNKQGDGARPASTPLRHLQDSGYTQSPRCQPVCPLPLLSFAVISCNSAAFFLACR